MLIGFYRCLSEIYYHSKMFKNYFRIFFRFVLLLLKYQYGLHLRLNCVKFSVRVFDIRTFCLANTVYITQAMQFFARVDKKS